MRPLWLSVLVVAACDGGSPPPTFTQVDDDVFSKGCAFSSCHGGGSGGLHLNGTAADHDALVDAPSTGKSGATLVVPGDADASYLVQKLEGAADIVGDPMPAGADALDPALIAEVRAWIDAGALP